MKNILGELIKEQHEKSNLGISDLSLCLCCETGAAKDELTCIDDAFSSVDTLDAATINHVDCLGMTPLKWACANHLAREVQQLIEIRADVNAAPAGKSALSVAIDVSDVDIVKSLIDAGADVNAYYCEYEEQCAIWSGGVVVLQSDCEESLLTRAIDVGDIDIVKLLIDGGAGVGGTAYEYSTPIMTAIFAQSIDIVKLLIDAGADVNRLGLEGDTALMVAALCDDVAAIKALLSAGADVAQTGWGELTAIDILESETIGVPPGSKTHETARLMRDYLKKSG